MGKIERAESSLIDTEEKVAINRFRFILYLLTLIMGDVIETGWPTLDESTERQKCNNHMSQSRKKVARGFNERRNEIHIDHTFYAILTEPNFSNVTDY